MKGIIRRTMCLVLAMAIIITTLATITFASDNVSGTDASGIVSNSDDEWTSLEAKLKTYGGEWENPDYSTAITPTMPRTALMGNGDVGVVSYGSDTSKAYLFSKGDFWTSGNLENSSTGWEDKDSERPIPLGGLTISGNGEKLLTRESEVTATSDNYISSEYPPQKAIDGDTSSDGWVSNGVPASLTINLGSVKSIGRYVLYNNPDSRAITKAYTIEASIDNSTWTEVANVADNTSGCAKGTFATSVKAQYVKLTVTNPGTYDSKARVKEFELYEASDANKVTGKILTRDSGVTVSADNYLEEYPPQNVMDGITAVDGWVSSDSVSSSTPVSLTYDFGNIKTIGRYAIYHNKDSSATTKDFKIEASTDNNNWSELVNVTNNTLSYTTGSFTATNARYARLTVTNPGTIADQKVRIAEFELYEASPSDEKLIDINSASSEDSLDESGYPPAKLFDGDSTTDGWVSNGTTLPASVTFDLGSEKYLTRYALYHNSSTEAITKSYVIQASTDGEAWSEIASVDENNSYVTGGVFSSIITARYVKITITNPGNYDTKARLREFQLYGVDSNSGSGDLDYTIKEKQDIVNADLTTDMVLGGVPVEINSWLSATENTFITKITSKDASSKLSLNVDVWGKLNSNVPEYQTDSGIVDNKQIWASRKTYNSAADNVQSWTSEAVITTKLLGDKQVTAEKKSSNNSCIGISLDPGETVYLITTVGGGGQTYSHDGTLQKAAPLTEATGLLDKYEGISDVENLKAMHLEWWKEYWLKSYIDIGREDWHRYYYGSLYYMGCTARADKAAPGIFGIWTTTDANWWNNDYHLNYNFMAPFYGMYSSNRYESSAAMLQPFLDFLPQAKEDAANPDVLKIISAADSSKGYSSVGASFWSTQTQLYDGIANAALFPVSLGPWGTVPWNVPDRHNYQNLNGLFAATVPISYYNYTQDMEYLKKAYPLLERVANFYTEWAQKEELADGTYQYNIYDSPHEGAQWFGKNSGVTIGLAEDLYEFIIKNSDDMKEAGIDVNDSELAAWKEIYEHMAPIPIKDYTANNSATGNQAITMPVFALSEKDIIHWEGATVNLEFVQPGDRLTFDSDKYLRQIGRNTIKMKELAFYNSPASYSGDSIWWCYNNNPKMFDHAIRVGCDPAYVMKMFQETDIDNVGKNFTIDDGHHGIEKAGGIEFINNMLLQSTNSIIKVFPNWTGEDASFTRLREKDAFLVSSKMVSSEVQYIDVTSEAGKDANIVIPWDKSTAVVKTEDGSEVATTYGRTANTKENTVKFATQKGENYIITKGDSTIEDPTQYKVSIAATPNGTVTVDVDKAEAGEKVLLTVTSNANYHLKRDSLKVNEGAVAITDNSFIMPASDVTVSAIFEKDDKVTIYNDDNANTAYTGGGWEYSSNRSPDYMNDVHQTTKKGDYVEFTFSGTGIEYIGVKNLDIADQEIFIDGISQGVQTVRTAQSGYVAQSVIYSNLDLTSGEHTIKVVYQDGADGSDYMVVDAFKVYSQWEKYNVTVEGGKADKESCVEGDTVTVTADEPAAGKVFAGWITAADSGVSFADAAAKTATFVMPANDVTVKANYEDVIPGKYSVTVEGGKADKGSYTAGETVTLTADEPAAGKVFAGWTSDSGVIFADAAAKTATFVMPANDVAVKANYEDVIPGKYSVTVEGGKADKESYTAGETVTLTADEPAAGKVFAGWTATTDSGVSIADAAAKTATFVMPANDVTIKAEFNTATYAMTILPGTGGSITTGSDGSYMEGAVIQITAKPDSGYSFGEWTSEGGGSFASTASASTTFTMPANTVKITAGFNKNESKDTDKSGSTSSNSTTTTTTTYNASVSGADKTGENLLVEINTSAGSAEVNLGISAGDVFSGKGTTVIHVPSIPGVDNYTLGIPAGSMTGSGEQRALTFSTYIGSITIPDNMLSGVPGAEGKEAGITISEGDKTNLPDKVTKAIGDRPLMQLTMTLDGKQTEWNNSSAPVTVSIPYKPTTEELTNPEGIVVWYIDGSGSIISVPSGRYDPSSGTVTFTTTHFSYYTVAYVHKTFGDLGSAEWARKSIEAMASKGIINGIGANTFSPSDNISRADYLVMLVKTLGLTADFKGNFDDAVPGTYYYEALGIAKKLGIATGCGNNRFNPQGNISRQDMTVLAARTIEKFKKLKAINDTNVLDKFNDKGDIAGYAVESLATLVKEGLISGSGDKLNPRAQTTRAEAAVFLYRIYMKY